VSVVILADESISDLISYDSEGGDLIMMEVQDKHIGLHEFSIYLVDQRNGSTLYEFELNVTRPVQTFKGVEIQELTEEQQEEF
jgi:hypothetical protein